MENKTKRDLALISLVSEYEDMSAKGDVAYLQEKAYVQLINYYQDDFNYKKALEVVNFALIGFQYRAEFHIIKAKLLYQKNQFDECEAVLDHAEAISPFELDIRLLRAKTVAAQGRNDEGIAIIQDLKTYATKGDLVEIYITEAYVYEWMHDYYSMFDSLKEALLIEPRNLEALEKIWLSVELSKRYEESIKLHDIIIEEEPYSYLAWFNLGHAYSFKGDYEEAIMAMEYSFIIDPEFEAGYIDCAELCFQLKKYAKAKEVYLELIERFGVDAEHLVNLAHCQFQLEEYPAAMKNIQKAIKLDPYDDEAFFLLANCHILSSNWHQAMNALNQAIIIDDYREEYYHALARIFVNIGDFKKAKLYYKKAAITGEEQPLYWEEFIAFLIKINDYVDALKMLDKAEKYTYSDKLTYCRSIIYMKLDDRKKAIEILEEALIENFENHRFYLDLAPELNYDREILSAINYYLGEQELIKSSNT